MVRIQEANSNEQIRQAAQIFADAFANDPSCRAMFPSEEACRKLMAADVTLGLKIGYISTLDVAIDEETGKVIGALTSQSPDGKVNKIRNTLLDIFERFTPSGRRERFHESKVEAFRPQEKHWYLRTLGAAPEARGQGVGSKLLRHRLDIIDSDPTPAFLESTTPASQRLYKRFGFETVADVDTLPGITVYAMIRPAKVKALV
ncbi:GNAT family N-acetyltransferase [Winkia neuii]|uniref:GNAT family N-acetyltransferase n=2 Tax=Winkia TaxID=2692118 RepID=A0AB38XMY4_9ACTO|nr:GNAT family N-acetyltransferase [Winkia neuii]WCE45712.1 GNAT family N-acetyltransferase [Winkia neuii subsp. anitrata]